MEITTHNPFRALSNTRFKFRSCERLQKPLVSFRFSWLEALLFQDLSLLFLLFVFVFSLKPVSCAESFQVRAPGTTCWVACSRSLHGLGAWELQSPIILFKPCKTSLTATLSSLMLWITFNNVSIQPCTSPPPPRLRQTARGSQVRPQTKMTTKKATDIETWQVRERTSQF